MSAERSLPEARHDPKSWIAERASDLEWVEERRKRLTDLGWFMKSLKEPIARRANHEDKCTGALGEGRFRSVAILDDSSLLATCAYIDLNPVAAGIAPTPEKSPHTSIKSRVDHCEAQGKLDTLRGGSPYASKVNVEQAHWLLPIEVQRDQNENGLPGNAVREFCSRIRENSDHWGSLVRNLTIPATRKSPSP